jgi:RNA-binding protein
MSTLPQELRQVLKTKAHQLKPVVMIGGKGLSEPVHVEIARALHDHELIKIRVSGEDRDARKAMIADICLTHQAAIVQQIGHIVAIYKKREE